MSTTPIPITATIDGKQVAAFIAPFKRDWTKFAPQLLAFAATSAGATLIVGLLVSFGIHLPPTLTVLLVGFVSSLAAFIKSDVDLGLSARVIGGKLAVFILTGISAAVVTNVAGAVGVALPAWVAPLVVTVAGIIVGYLKADSVAVPAGGVPQAVDTAPAI